MTPTTALTRAPYAPARELLPPPRRVGRHGVRFAETAEDLDAVLRLRYEVFNLELGEGLAASAETGRDEDPFDAACHHLIAEADGAPGPIGTYRMQTRARARAHLGFYTATLFDVGSLPGGVLDLSVEVGRACIARPYRSRLALFALWKGLADYVEWNRKRYLFGCCSLTSQDERHGARAYRWLRKRGFLHPGLRVGPRPACACFGGDEAGPDLPEDDALRIPQLFDIYLRYGARVLGPPAIDREFGTVDFLVLLDVEAMDPSARRLFFG
jgi:putative hemolysin